MPFEKIVIDVNSINLKKNEFCIFFKKNHLVCYIHLGNITINGIMNMPTTQKSISGPSPSPLLFNWLRSFCST